MNLKSMLKSVDYKGLALQHCEKVVIAVVTALLVLFLVSGIKTAMTASSVTPQRIDQLADTLNRNIQTSEWNESVADREQVKNPDFKAEIAKLMTGIRPDQFALAQLYYKFLDFGGILRQKPDILSPYHSLALADKGALSLYKLNSKGEFIEKEVVVKTVAKKKPDDEAEKKKKAVAKAPSKMPMRSAGMSSGPSGGGGMGDMMMGEYGGGMGGRKGMAQSGGGGVGGGTGDAGIFSGDNEPMGGNIGASRQRRTSGNIRRDAAAKRLSDEAAYDEAEDNKPPAAGAGAGEKGDPKKPQKRMVKEEEIRGVRWALITALFSHKDQVKKYIDALHTADDPPDYKMVKVERREVMSDGSLSEWSPLDIKKLLDVQKRIPEHWVPEDATVKAAKADFAGLMMKLPDLEVGNWLRYIRKEAVESAKDVAGAQYASRGRGESGDDGRDDDPDAGALFNSGAGAQSRPMAEGPTGLSGGMGMGMSGRSGGVGASRSMQGMQSPGGAGPSSGGGGMSMSGMGGGGNMLNKRGGNAAPPTNKAQGQPQQPVQKSNVEVVQVRFVDYTVEPEHTYQYRLKVVVRNPNYKHFDVINPELANDEQLSSDEWSEPTPLVYVPPDIEYYVLDRVRTREEATLQVHNWLAELGDWQYSDFKIRPGDPIGSKVREYQMVGWENPPKITKKEFDFSTQDLLLNVTGGDRPFVFDVDGAQVQFTERLPTEILVVDRLGDLAVRNDDFDKNNADRVDRVKYINEIKEKAKANEDKESKKATGKAETGSKDDFEGGRTAPTRREDK
jgi:hypothetical protein